MTAHLLPPQPDTASIEADRVPVGNPVNDTVPTLAPTVRKAQKAEKAPSWEEIDPSDDGIRLVLSRMRILSGVGHKTLSKRMEVAPETVRQYFSRGDSKPANRGSGRMSIAFLAKFARACGCRVLVSYPNQDDQ